MKQIYILIFFTLSFVIVQGQNNCVLKGRITNSSGSAIPYCSVYLPDVGKGSMANVDGEFSITVPCGEYQLMVQSLGYERKAIKVSLQANSSDLDLQLNDIAYQIQEVTIDPSSEDPAYNIIRKATVMSEFYSKQIEEYKCTLYVRSFFNVEDLPWIAEKLADEEDLADIKTGDITETLLEYTYKKPNTVHERILAKKTASIDTSKTGSSYINLNFYNLGGNEIINPLSREAFKVYKFEHIHTELQGIQKVHKIKIIPKRKGTDLMKGHLYINDGLWNLNNVDVEFEQPFATLKYKQLYQAVSNNAWMPINHQIKANVKILGTKVKFQYLATLSDLTLSTNPSVDEQIKKHLNLRTKENEGTDVVPDQQIVDRKLSKGQEKIENLMKKEKLTNAETVKLVRLIKKQEREIQREEARDTVQSMEVTSNRKVEYADSALADNDSLWQTQRQIPLSEVEKNIYVQRDSLNKVQSGDTVINKKQSLLGKLWNFNSSVPSKNKNIRFSPNGLIVGWGAQFNTVDGLRIKKDLFTYRWDDRKGKYYTITPIVEYAEARKTFLGTLNFNSQYNPLKRSGINFSAGRRSSDFSQSDPYEPIINSFSTLIFTENYSKIYQEDFAYLEHHFDIKNGLSLSTSIEFSDRSQQKNNSDFMLLDFADKEYSSNIPLNPEVFAKPQKIASNKATTVAAKLSYTPKQRYYIRDGRKQMLRSSYPTFDLNYQQGIGGLFESKANYQSLSFAVHQSLSYRLIDEINYHFEAGKFLRNNSVSFADYKNFNTNPFFVMGGTHSNSFKILDLYEFNTDDYYFEGHLSIEDKHILLKYLPLLNNTNLSEELHFNYLLTEKKTNYYEMGYSLNRLFLFINVGTYVSFIDDEFENFGFRIGVNL